MNFLLLFLMVLLQSLMLYSFVTWGLLSAIVTGVVFWIAVSVIISRVGGKYE
jgi:hypothetical protein